MKKLLGIALALIMLFTFVGCMTSEPASSNAPSSGTATSGGEKEPAKAEETASYEITDSRITVWSNSIGTTWMQGIVEVTNTGSTDLYLSSGKFEIDDSNGSIVEVVDLVSVYPDVIAPGEKAYYAETTLDSPADLQYTLNPKVSVKKAKVEVIRYNTYDFKLTDTDYFGIKAVGRI